jgi:sec-independent protein translocase protein TatA
MGEFSAIHWLIVILIALLLFAPAKFGSLGKGLAEGIRNFKAGLKSPEEKKDENTGEKKP